MTQDRGKANQSPNPMMRWHRAPDPFERLTGGGGDLAERLFHPVIAAGAGSGMLLAFDARESDHGYAITLDAPGVKKRDIEVSLSPGRLTISCERYREEQGNGDLLRQAERPFGVFKTTIALPNGLDEDKIAATLASGVLTIKIPKSEAAGNKSRKIAITAP